MKRIVSLAGHSRLCRVLKICFVNHSPINPGNVGSPLKISIRIGSMRRWMAGRGILRSFHPLKGPGTGK